MLKVSTGETYQHILWIKYVCTVGLAILLIQTALSCLSSYIIIS